MNFGKAIEAIKAGKRVARRNWNGKGMFIFLCKKETFKACTPMEYSCADENGMVHLRDRVMMYTADGEVVPWVCSQSDMLEEDWVIVE